FHNLHFYVQLMARLRTAIGRGELQGFAADFLARQQSGLSMP
ncbi:MAG: tRNA guanosine(34) transglycosylase Tgt, partial [Gammaproteobacteria bacterium]|nr:tRNA guanosine(34) transglycosylase Tgt [Gammaproteobacteria bacterium]